MYAEVVEVNAPQTICTLKMLNCLSSSSILSFVSLSIPIDASSSCCEATLLVLRYWLWYINMDLRGRHLLILRDGNLFEIECMVESLSLA